MATSEFAKRQLKKHGWKEGSGLGKQENGRSEPIKVSLKMDKTGVGHDPGKEFTDHWWLRVFNEAAQKIGKKKQQDDSRSNDMDELRQKKIAESKNNLYKGFVKSSTLTNGVEEKHKHSDSSSEDSTDEDSGPRTSLPTLNDIHKFCGGATGHKAARFGIKMGGKLERIAQHEKMFEERLKKEKLSASRKDSSVNSSLHDPKEQTPSLSDTVIPCENGGDKKRKKKKKHKKQKKENCSEKAVDGGECFNEELTGGADETVHDGLSESACKKNTVKHKKKKYIAEIALVEDSVKELCQDGDTQHRAKSKKKRKRHSVTEDTVCVNEIETLQNKKTEEHTCSNELLDESDSKSIKKKKKRKKHKE